MRDEPIACAISNSFAREGYDGNWVRVRYNGDDQKEDLVPVREAIEATPERPVPLYLRQDLRSFSTEGPSVMLFDRFQKQRIEPPT